MDAAQPRPSSEIVVKIPRSKLKGCEELWTKGAKIKETYKKNVGEKMRNDCDEGEDDEEEPTVPITHFKKRLIRAHSASAAPIQNPSKSNDDWPRVGRHHLPATTPVGPTHRRRSQNSIDLTHKKENQDPHQSLEREFPKVLDNFLALIEAIRDYSCFNDHKQIISAGIVDVESFLRKCNHIATNYPLSGDQDNFNSLLECIRDFTRKIREMIFDDKVITGPILTPIEEKFYKNVFYRVFEHLSPKFDLASVNCIIWNRVHILDSTKMIVVPVMEEENVKNDGEKEIEMKENEKCGINEDVGENKEEVKQQIAEMEKKKPKYKVTEILCIEIDSDCESGEEDKGKNNDIPVKEEPVDDGEKKDVENDEVKQSENEKELKEKEEELQKKEKELQENERLLREEREKAQKLLEDKEKEKERFMLEQKQREKERLEMEQKQKERERFEKEQQLIQSLLQQNQIKMMQQQHEQWMEALKHQNELRQIQEKEQEKLKAQALQYQDQLRALQKREEEKTEILRRQMELKELQKKQEEKMRSQMEYHNQLSELLQKQQQQIEAYNIRYQLIEREQEKIVQNEQIKRIPVQQMPNLQQLHQFQQQQQQQQQKIIEARPSIENQIAQEVHHLERQSAELQQRLKQLNELLQREIQLSNLVHKESKYVHLRNIQHIETDMTALHRKNIQCQERCQQLINQLLHLSQFSKPTENVVKQPVKRTYSKRGKSKDQKIGVETNLEPQSKRANESLDVINFKQQFPNTVITQIDNGVTNNTNDGRVVVLDSGRVAEGSRSIQNVSAGQMNGNCRKQNLSESLNPPNSLTKQNLTRLTESTQSNQIVSPNSETTQHEKSKNLSQFDSNSSHLPLNSSKSPNLLHPENSSSVSSEMAANARKVNGSIAIGGLESLSKKGSLNPNEYVDELKKLKNLTDIPDDFKSFYMYLTKTQILNQHNPIGFLLFMELFNEKGLGLQYKGYKEYLRRKDKTISPPIIPYHLLFQHYGESPQNVPINLIVSDSHPVSTSAPSLINSNPNKFIPPPNNLPLLPTPVPLIPQSSHHHLPPTPPPSLPPTPSVQIRKS